VNAPSEFAGLTFSGDAAADIANFLRSRDRADTLRHCRQVAAAGLLLARRFGLPPAPVRLACLAHDLAVIVPLHNIVAAAEKLKIQLREADRSIPQVVHGQVAAVILRDVLGARDEAVLAAVSNHTTLRANAGPIEAVVFVADKLAYDPTSRHIGYHVALTTRAATAPLPDLCWIYLDWAVSEGPELGWQLHPKLLAAWAELRPQTEV
jgi:HD superfamily phosphohydrolase YqeK